METHGTLSLWPGVLIPCVYHARESEKDITVVIERCAISSAFLNNFARATLEKRSRLFNGDLRARRSCSQSYLHY
jgi:hypothetical protein